MDNLEKEYERLLEEEKSLYFDSFSREDAYKIGTLLINKSQEKGPLAVEITLNGLMVFRFYPTGTTRDNQLFLNLKRNSVEFREMSSQRLTIMAAKNHQTLEEWKLNPAEYVLMGGGFPIKVKNTGLVGCICVSGYPPVEDHQIIVDSIKEYISSIQA